MYICICNGITERDIREAAAAGARTIKDLQRELGVCAGCGKCASCARAVLCETRTPDEFPAPSFQPA
jgi:bacterioferritin-associated ferredoxin